MALGGQVNKVVNYTLRMSGTGAVQRGMRQIQTAAVAMAAATTAAMLALAKSSVDLAGDFIELENQFNVTFGESAPRAREEIDAFAASVDRSGDRMLGMAASIQAMLVPMGVMRDEAAGMSVTAVQLATDLGSFWNEDSVQVMNDMQSAFAGMSRPMRKYGIDVSDAAIDAELFRMGIEGGSEAATRAEQSIARLNIMVNQAGDAIGDTARTADEWQNQLRALEDAWYDIRVEIGQELIPILQELLPDVESVMGEIGEAAIEILPRFIQGLVDAAPAVLELAGNMVILAEGITLAIEGWNKLLSNESFDTLVAMGNEFEQIIPTVDQATAAMERFYSVFPRFAPGFAEGRESIMGGVSSLGSIVSGFLSDAEAAGAESPAGGGGGITGKVDDMVYKFQTIKKDVVDIKDLFKEMDDITKGLSDKAAHASVFQDEQMREQLAMAQQNTDILVSGAQDFIGILRRGGDDFGEDMMRMIARMLLEMAKMQFGKSFGPIGGILGAFL